MELKLEGLIMKKMLSVLLLLSMILTVSACGNAKSQEGSSEEVIKVAGVVFQEDQFMRLLSMGYKAAADEYGVKVSLSNTNNDQSKEVELINTYISQEIDGIAISPINHVASIETLKSASEKGISVSIANTDLEKAPFIAGGFTSDNYLLGQQTGESCAAFIKENYKEGEEVRVALLQFRSQLPELSALRSDGFVDQIKDIPGVVIVADQDSWMQDQAIQTAGDIITAQASQGGVDIIWGANDGATIGSVMAVKNAGLSGKTYVFGTDAAEQQLKMLKNEDNILQAVTGQDPYMIGYKTMEVLIKEIKGEDTGYEKGKTQIQPGILLERSNEEGLDEFAKQLEEYK